MKTMAKEIRAYARRVWEATASREELIEAHEGKRTLRLFRVEGTPYGNSHLLTAEDAYATCRKYGGDIRQILPGPGADFEEVPEEGHQGWEQSTGT